MGIKVSKTYEVVTPESAEYGDADERGFEYESVDFSFRELVREMENYCETSEYPLDPDSWDFWLTSESDLDYQEGVETRYSLHFDRSQHPRYRKYWRLAWRMSRH